jgi:hypothetical protein
LRAMMIRMIRMKTPTYPEAWHHGLQVGDTDA